MTIRDLAPIGALILAGPCVADVVVVDAEEAFLERITDAAFESFETLDADQPVSMLEFGGELQVGISSVDVSINRVVEESDGYGAIAHEGDQFWKLLGGRTTLSFGESVDGFGFWYSDREWATVAIYVGSSDAPSLTLDLLNPNDTGFVGFVAEESFDQVTIAWETSHFDGVGFDRMMAGTSTIPAPATIACLAIGGLGGARRRRARWA